MSNIDWNSINEQFTPKYKDYAPAGKHTVKLAEVEIHEVGSNGSIAQDFKFEDDDNYAFPKATHWLSFKNDAWRQWHNKSLMVVLGVSEEQAKKAVEVCESKSGKDEIVKAYIDAYKRIAGKHPKVEIEVWQDGKYKVAEFTDGSVRMNRPETNDQPELTPSEEFLSDAEPADISSDDLPF